MTRQTEADARHAKMLIPFYTKELEMTKKRFTPNLSSPKQKTRTTLLTFDMCDYESHEEMVEKLESLATQYPNLAMVGSVGNSVQGRPLAYIKISGNVSHR